MGVELDEKVEVLSQDQKVDGLSNQMSALTRRSWVPDSHDLDTGKRSEHMSNETILGRKSLIAELESPLDDCRSILSKASSLLAGDDP